jgi:hypothetical protein
MLLEMNILPNNHNLKNNNTGLRVCQFSLCSAFAKKFEISPLKTFRITESVVGNFIAKDLQVIIFTTQS